MILPVFQKKPENIRESLAPGYVMTGIGFVMILINAADYLPGRDLKSPAFTIPGLVLIVAGAQTARKSSWMLPGLSF